MALPSCHRSLLSVQTHLPIWQVHREILDILGAGNRLVLVAPTGSGKTTQVPQMLLDGGLATQASGVPGKVIVLQPRRVAARTVAARVAWERQCELGREVGYQIRFEDRTSQGTRISFVTEGVLLRWLQEDRALAGVAAILFDEFHERNLFSDVALALVKHLQQTSRPDLKVAVMSATLDARPVADYLGGCPVVISEGQSYPVEVRFQDCHDERPIQDQAADAVEGIINAGEQGDILVFMPGMAEINATIGTLHAARTRERLAFIPLHGDLPAEEQDRAFAPCPMRKVVVATNVAETSVTIDGIRHVVDSGLARVARYDVERGINTLLLEPISRASADQRKGRAGRTAPGTCHRLWTESGHLNRPERNTPEIQRSDLAEVVLLLHSLGIHRAADFDWLDRPDAQAVERAETLLIVLGAIRVSKPSGALPVPTGAQAGFQDGLSPTRAAREESDLTPVGRQMLRLPMHPRYSRMLVEASRLGCVPAAALCAALVSGRDLLMRLGRDDKHIAEARELFEGSPASDFHTLMRAYQFAKNRGFAGDACRRYGIHAQTARLVEQTFQQIMQIARQQRLAGAGDQDRAGEAGEARAVPADSANPESKEPRQEEGDEPLLRCLLAGFIDQLCIRRDKGTLDCEMTEGRTGTLMRESVVQDAPMFVAASIREVAGRGSGPLTLLGMASAVRREWIEEMFPELVTARVEHLFDRTHKRVAAVRLVRFMDLVVHHEHQRDIEPEASGRCLAEAHRKGWFELPLLNHELRQFIARVNLVAAAMPELEFAPLDAEAVERCVARGLAGVATVKEAQGTELREAFYQHLVRGQREWLNELAPLTVAWHDGRRLKLQYVQAVPGEKESFTGAELQVKLHECFLLKEHPRVCERRVAVKLWLCGPDGKRLESTQDWPEFRSAHYPKLKPVLQRRYPGMAWL